MTSTQLIWIALSDLVVGLHEWRLWGKFAWHDMRARYRGSRVGPYWLILTTAVFVGALSIVYGALFRVDVKEYVPFVAIGVVVWAFISSVANESVMTFVEAETFIRQMRLNLFVYVLRVVWRNIIVFAHQFLVAVLVLIIFAKLDLRTMPFAIIGMALLVLQAIWIVPLLGLIGARFRDLQPIIANLLQLFFFITPVLWYPSLLGDRRWIADLNPLHSLISVVREPLLGNMPTTHNYAVVVATTAVGLLVSMLFYGRFRLRLVYWL